jgi:type IV pilus assembly protein PilV
MKMVLFLSWRFRRRSSEGGFTILEAIFAISILAVGILAVASLQGSAIRSNGSAVELADATARISSQLEVLTMLPFTAPELDSGGNPHVPVASGPYEIRWNVADSVSGDSKTIGITVRWNDRGVPKEVSLRHILTNTRS